MKTVLGILFIAVGAFIGKRATDKYSVKLKYFQSMLEFNRETLKNLSYLKESLIELSKTEYPSAEFDETLKSAFVAEKEILLPDYLDESESRFVRNYFQKIGKNVESAEFAFLRYSECEIEKLVEKYSQENKKYGSLGLKLGVAAGAAAFIVIL